MRHWPLLALLFVWIGLTTLPASAASDDPPLLLPDLQTLPPTDLDIQTFPGGTRLLRLDNTIWNSGSGPLELIGEYNRLTRKTQVTQHIYATGSKPIERVVGEFVFHPGHSHWHFEDFALYQLWSINTYGDLLQIVAASEKLSYCLLDTSIVTRHLPDFARWGSYFICGQKEQGLSVGWGDTYDSFLDGQSLDVTDLPDGLYALLSTTNPNRTILESSYDNNTAATYLQLTGDTLTTLKPPHLNEALCLAQGWC